jgi:hypothetical protein
MGILAAIGDRICDVIVVVALLLVPVALFQSWTGLLLLALILIRYGLLVYKDRYGPRIQVNGQAVLITGCDSGK